MKLTCVTAVFNAIKSGNRENLIRCVRSVAALKTPHEHLIYDGGSTDGTVELLRELESEVQVESRSRRADGDVESKSRVEVEERMGLSLVSDADEKSASTGGGESGTAGVRALPGATGMSPQRGGESGDVIDVALPKTVSSASPNSSFVIPYSSLRVVSEPDTGIYNALNKGVRDARGEWFYVLGCDDYIEHPEVLDRIVREIPDSINHVATTVKMVYEDGHVEFHGVTTEFLKGLFCASVCNHQGILMRTSLVRSLSGFDERFTISADTNMFLRTRVRHEPILYLNDQFAVFTHGGTADSNVEIFSREDRQCMAEAFGLSARQTKAIMRTGLMPISVCLRHIFDSDLAIRFGAWYMISRHFKLVVRLLFYPIVVLTRPIRYGKS